MKNSLFIFLILFLIGCENEVKEDDSCVLQVNTIANNQSPDSYFSNISVAFQDSRDSILKYDVLLKEQPQFLLEDSTIRLLKKIIASNDFESNSKMRLLKAKALRLHSTIHFYQLDYDKAIAELNQAMQFITPPVDRMHSLELADIMNYIGLAFDSQLNYPQAIEYLKKSYDLNVALGRKDDAVKDLVNIGIAFKSGNVLDSALHYVELGICIVENNNLGLPLEDSLAIFNTLTPLYVESAEQEKLRGNLEKANQYYEKGIENGRNVLQKIIEMPGYFGIIPYFVSAQNLGNIFLQYNRLAKSTPDSAIHYLNMAKNPLRTYEEKSNRTLPDYWAVITFRMAAALAQKGDCEAAKKLFQQADKLQVSPQYRISRNFQKGKSMNFCGEGYDNDFARLTAQLEQYERAIDDLEGLLHTPGLESVVSSFRDKFGNIYHQPIKLAYQICTEKPSETNVKELLQLLDRGKSFNLKQQIYQKVDELSFNGLKKNLFDKEMLLRNKLMANPDDLNAQLELKNFIDNLRQSSNPTHFQYYLKRLNKPEYNLGDIRQYLLSDSTAIIQYYTGPQEVYAVAITPQRQKVFVLPNSEQIENLGQKYHQSLHPNLPKNSLYRENAYPLYQQLFEPIQHWLKEEKIDHLIIIPDGILQKIPFEGLLTTDHLGKPYGELNYLMNDYEIGYHFSISSMLALNQLSRLNTKATAFSFLGLNAANINEQSSTSISGNSNNPPLPELAEVAQMTAEQMKSKGREVKFFSDASVNNFSDFANQAAIIQLTMHAFLNIENPTQSYLQFNDTPEERLAIKDIYPRDLNNVQLAVLSNCNTLDGAFSKGEGLTSLVRAFMYAGCSSLVGAVNAIEDKATAAILEQFYVALLNGNTKYQALSIAKKKYLKNNPNAHPQLWLNLIYLGDNQPIDW